MEEKIQNFVEEVRKEILNLNNQLEEKQYNFDKLLNEYSKLNCSYIKLNKDYDYELSQKSWGMFLFGFSIGCALIGILKFAIG